MKNYSAAYYVLSVSCSVFGWIAPTWRMKQGMKQMNDDANEKQRPTWRDALENLGEDVDKQYALELKLQIVRKYFKDFGSVPAFHNFKDLAHLRASLTFNDPIDKRIKAKIDDAIRARMAVRLGSTDIPKGQEDET